MNQFKKAKQKQLASGRPMESISDLQTAGVKKEVVKDEIKKIIEEPAQETKKTETVSEKTTTENASNNETTSNNQTDQVIAKENKTETVIVEVIPEIPAKDENSTLNEVVQNDAETENKNEQDNTEIISSEKDIISTVSNEIITDIQAESNNTSDSNLHTSNNINTTVNNIVTTGETNKIETTIINENIAVKEENISEITSATITAVNINENSNVATNKINNVIENNSIEHSVEAKNVHESLVITNVPTQNLTPQEALQPVNQMPVMTPVNIQTVTEPMVQQPMNVTPVTNATVFTPNITEIENRQIYPGEYPAYSESMVTKQTPHKTAKKNIPNIFAPKGEAKSMRKSLVLKPTSVKIAENYCAKNGGSFNELIQTLLDNFIDEYGL